MGYVIGVIVVFIVGFFVYENHKEKERAKKSLQDKLDNINVILGKFNSTIIDALAKWKHLTNYSTGYFSSYTLSTWKNKFLDANEAIKGLELKLEGITNSKEAQEFINTFQNAEAKRKKYNEDFVKHEIEEYKNFFHNIEKNGLDIQQRTAIVTDEDNNLVIAGAGTGKTTTVAGKVSYLIKRYNIDPKEILLISFTNKACDEMRDRIKKKLNINVDVRTFNALGLHVIAESRNEKPCVFDLKKRETDEIFQGLFQKLMKDKEYLELVTKYFTSYLKPYKEENEFKSEGERMQFLKDQNLFGLKKIKLEGGIEYRERLKSQEEVEIANFLFLHDINYTYEEWYEFKTASRTFGQYKPDFKINGYLNSSKRGIYLEHFAMIDKLGNVPNWFKGDENQTATQKYNSGIKWKRNLHEEKGTTLIETYSYERKEGNLIPNLIQKLRKNNIEVKEKSPEQIWQLLEENAKEDISAFIQLVQTFLSLLKSNNYTLTDIETKAKKIDKDENRLRALAFLKIFKPFYNLYEKILSSGNDKIKQNTIDFSDMINKAAEYIQKGEFQNNYKYIIIDEFQDISIGRYQLIKAMLNQNPNCKLFCVGDDWQSVYRFSGSDIAIFTKFDEYFGATSKTYIEKTYRFDNKMIAVSSEFILRNPKQFKKGLKSDKVGNEKPFTVLPYNFNSIKKMQAI